MLSHQCRHGVHKKLWEGTAGTTARSWTNNYSILYDVTLSNNIWGSERRAFIMKISFLLYMLWDLSVTINSAMTLLKTAIRPCWKYCHLRLCKKTQSLLQSLPNCSYLMRSFTFQTARSFLCLTIEITDSFVSLFSLRDGGMAGCVSFLSPFNSPHFLISVLYEEDNLYPA